MSDNDHWTTANKIYLPLRPPRSLDEIRVGSAMSTLRLAIWTPISRDGVSFKRELPPQKTTPGENHLAGRGLNETYLVGVVEALANPSRPARRLLDMAERWSDLTPSSAHHKQAPQTARQLRPAEVDELVATYDRGATVYDLAARFGINRRTVGKHLRTRGIDTTPPGLHPDDVPAAADLYQAGWALARIAEKFDTTANTVRARLLEVGVRMRDPQGREP